MTVAMGRCSNLFDSFIRVRRNLIAERLALSAPRKKIERRHSVALDRPTIKHPPLRKRSSSVVLAPAEMTEIIRNLRNHLSK